MFFSHFQIPHQRQFRHQLRRVHIVKNNYCTLFLHLLPLPHDKNDNTIGHQHPLSIFCLSEEKCSFNALLIY